MLEYRNLFIYINISKSTNRNISNDYNISTKVSSISLHCETKY